MGAADLLSLQGKIKRDPEGYWDEFLVHYRHYQSRLSIFSLKPTAEAEEFGELVTFIAQVATNFKKETVTFPQELMTLLRTHSNVLNPSLRRTLAQALILLRNRQVIASSTLLPLFFHLFRCPDKSLRQLMYSHIVNDIRRGNKKHNNVQFNRPLQNFLYDMVLDDSEVAAKKSLAVLIELHRRNVWRDSRTVNVIATACFHKQGRILVAALKFFLVNDEEGDGDGEDEDEDDEDDDEDGGGEGNRGGGAVGAKKEDIYKAYHSGATRHKKKKQAKLKRVMRSLKRSQKCKASDGGASFTAIQLLNDPQGFADKLFARLKSSNERFEVKLMMMSVISRVVGTHKLALLNFYPYLQRYVQPHQRDVTRLLAAAIQACHEQVPPDAVEPLLKQVVNQFVHDRARPEVIAVGLNTVRDMCLRMPLIMTEDLLRDLALYKKERQKAVSSAARGIIALFRELKPSLLEKKDRGRGADLNAKPLEFGDTTIAEGVPGLGLLLRQRKEDEEEKEEGDDDVGDSEEEEEEDEGENDDGAGSMEDEEGEDRVAGRQRSSAAGNERDDKEGEEDENGSASECVNSSDGEEDEEEEDEEDEDEEEEEEEEEEQEEGEGEEMERAKKGGIRGHRKGEEVGEEEDGIAIDGSGERKEEVENGDGTDKKNQEEKKMADVTMDMSLRTLKRLAGEKKAMEDEEKRKLNAETELLNMVNDGFLSNEDFKRIRELQSKKALEEAMAKHGIKKQNAANSERRKSFDLPGMMQRHNREAINERRVNPADLEAKIKRRREKEERMASVMAGREDREGFGASAARKKQKTGGTSNREKQRKKVLPLAAQWEKAKVRSAGKKRRAGIAAKQFRGKKAWK